MTELGGPLSHAAVVAREFGVPSVVNVDGATRAIRTGDVLRVDGDRGVVSLERSGRPRRGAAQSSVSSRSTSDESGGGAIVRRGARPRRRLGRHELAHEVRAVVDAELPVEPAHVRAHGVLAEARDGGDVHAAVAGDEEPRDLALALAQRPRSRVGPLRRLDADDGAARAAEDRVARRCLATAATEPFGRRGGVGSASPRARAASDCSAASTSASSIGRDVLLPVDAVLAVGGPDDALRVAVDDVERRRSPRPSARSAAASRESSSYCELRARAGDDERRERLERPARRPR